MGMPDFYIKINYSNLEFSDIEFLSQKFRSYDIFRILDEEDDPSHLSIECKFDNFIPSLIILYDNLYQFTEYIDSIETYGIKSDFTFTNISEFVCFVFSSNKSKLLSYYEQFGYLAIRSEGYYKSRNKLKKYYKKLT